MITYVCPECGKDQKVSKMLKNVEVYCLKCRWQPMKRIQQPELFRVEGER